MIIATPKNKTEFLIKPIFRNSFEKLTEIPIRIEHILKNKCNELQSKTVLPD